MPSRADVDRLAEANANIRELATRPLEQQWRTFEFVPGVDLDPIRDAVIAVNQATVTTYADAAAVVAADHYEQTRYDAGIRSRFAPVLADPPDPDQIAAATRWALDPLYESLDGPGALARLTGVVDRLALSTSNETIIRNALADPDKPRFARIPVGKTCEFCRMLASRGAVYRSEARAMSKRHPKCDCVVVAVHSPDDLPDDYDLEGLQAEYYSARAAAGSGDPSAILAEMRKGAAVREAARAAELQAAAKAAKRLERAARKSAKMATIDDIAARNGVTADEVIAAQGEVKVLRRRIADEAAADQYDALGILERAEAVKLRRPSSSRTGAAKHGDYDWVERIGRGERARLSRAWYTDSVDASVDQIAANLRRDLGGELVNMTDDQIISEVWLPLTRRIEASSAVRRGRLPSDRAYGGRIDPNQFAPNVAGDGYDVRKLLADDLEAAGHIARVNADQYADEAYRALGNAATPQHGPAPFEMSFQAWETEVRSIEAGLEGLEDLAMTNRVARERLAELVPADLDGPGFTYEDLYAAIVSTARSAALEVPARAVIPWAI